MAFNRIPCVGLKLILQGLYEASMFFARTLDRLMGFHVVRGTKAITFSPSVFLGDPAYRHIRDPWHLRAHRDYPDPKYPITGYRNPQRTDKKRMRKLRSADKGIT